VNRVSWCRRARRKIPLALPAAFCVMMAVPCKKVAAQSSDGRSDTPWFWQWTPLRSIGTLGTPSPSAPFSPHALDVPAPSIGLGWSGANPAGLADDLDRAWTAWTAGARGLGGSYRAPVDPSSASALSASLAGWRPVSENHRVIGRVRVEQSTIAAGDQAVFIDANPASPFTPTDTNAPAFSRTRVTLEGGDAVRLGSWRMGVTLGYDGVSDHAVQSRAAVTRRATSAGAGLGVARSFGDAAVVGLSWRRVLHTETVDLFADPGTVRIFPLDGYVSVAPDDHSIADAPFYRRVDHTGDAYGLDVSGTLRGTRWTAYAHGEESGETQVVTAGSGTPYTRWNTTGGVVGAAAQRVLGAIAATAAADLEVQRGTAIRQAESATSYTADASRLAFNGDLRWSSASRDVSAAAQIGLERQYQRASDRTARASTDITAWTPSGGVEVVWDATSARSWSAGFTTSRFVPFADLPSPTARGPAYVNLIAPALEMAAAPATSNTVSVGVRWHRLSSTVVARLSWSEISVAQRAVDATTLPAGMRSVWSAMLTVTPGVLK